MEPTRLPLADVRVIDLTVARAGPTAVRQLADWGADVVRIEPPATGRSEQLLDQRQSPDFQNLHRGKRCLALDLKTEAGHAILVDLVRSADILVENWRPGVKERLGVDYASLREINPRLVYGSISGFGQEGPYAQRGGVDQIAQGLGGLMSITGLPESGPVRVGVPISDLAAGMYLAIGLLVALHEREHSGEGQWVRTSLLEAMIAMLDFQAARWTVAGEVPEQAGNHHPTQIPMGMFPTADGHVNIAGPSGRLWRRFCETIEATELLEDEDYATSADRSRNRASLNERIGEILSKRTTAEWVERLNEAGVPCGPVNRIDQTMNDPQVRHLGMEVEVAHPQLGSISIVRNAVDMSRTPHEIRSASPEPGQHTDEILAELGRDEAEIDELRSKGVV